MKVICLVDNSVEPSSPFWGEHGLAFLIETERKRVLFDTGASGELLLHNLSLAGIDPADISAVALSHAHDDHTGGLAAFLQRRGRPPVYYAHPDFLLPRFSRHKEVTESIGLPLDPEALRRQADLRLSPTPQEILPGVWTTGEISARPEPEGRSPGHLLDNGHDLVPDPYRDDMALVLEAPTGLVLVCGCCHAGLLNTLLHVQGVFGRLPAAVIGGTHLVAAKPCDLRHTVEVLRRLGPPALYPNHCTGWAASVALATALGDRVAPCPAGSTLEF